jgi:hypothetical protein
MFQADNALPPTVLITLLLAAPVQLFRCRGAAKDGGTLEYVFEAGEQNSPNAVIRQLNSKPARAKASTRQRIAKSIPAPCERSPQ